VVTGGGSGIGRATALAFAREGAKIVVADVNREGGEETLRLIEQNNGEGLFIETDVVNGNSVEAMIRGAVDAFGAVNCAVNSAGVGGDALASPDDYSEDLWNDVLAVNLTGLWLSLKFEVREMLKQREGAIVNMASVAGLVGGPNIAYVASKHGVVGVTKSAALAYAKAGIRINALCPSFTETPLLDGITGGNPQIRDHLAMQQPLGRIGTVEEIAAAVLWLCSDASSYMTGHAMAVDGGYSAQ
jgi:NAD(P)-dependent dehydrogenase (short-subunit alcohol dehydrogenase family)